MLQQIMIDEFEDGLAWAALLSRPVQRFGEVGLCQRRQAEKSIARSMMRMTLQMNKKYFRQASADRDAAWSSLYYLSSWDTPSG